MKAVVMVRVAVQSIVKNAMRTLLTMLGIIIGVGAVIIMVAVGAGAQAQIERQVQGLGTNMLVVTAGAAQTGGSLGFATHEELGVLGPRVFAAGDICSQYKLTHAADASDRLVHSPFSTVVGADRELPVSVVALCEHPQVDGEPRDGRFGDRPVAHWGHPRRL